MNLENFLSEQATVAVTELFGSAPAPEQIQVQKTRKDFEGDLTLVVFPLSRLARKKPEEAGEAIGAWLLDNVDDISAYNVVKGFLNLSFSDGFWLRYLQFMRDEAQFGNGASSGRSVMVEYSSPNTNKPLHLGHIRNNLLGHSVSRILEANGHKVIKANLVNDRGIHICKSMLAWQKYGNGETPQSSGIKGDFLVGKYYVLFDKKYKEQQKEWREANRGDHPALTGFGPQEDFLEAINEKNKAKEPLTDAEKAAVKAFKELDAQAEKEVSLIREAQEMLRKWEAGDSEIVELWKTMNGWVYGGFDTTYKRLGVEFDQFYYESETYLLGKSVVEEGLAKKVLYQKEDGSVWADLSDHKLTDKLLLRSDGTSVYMTQDLGTAIERFNQFPDLKQLIYTVGDEQLHHFKVLFIILDKLGYGWAKECFHLSYGMVDLPEGKMKSREGTVVDADVLMREMDEAAEAVTREQGRIEGLTEEECQDLFHMIGLAAIKYFILKVDPKRRMTFNPKESVALQGNTGPFIQYTHARIRSIIRKSFQGLDQKVDEGLQLHPEERELYGLMSEYPTIVKEAGDQYSPALIANYVYQLAKAYNHFVQVIKINDPDQPTEMVHMRLAMSEQVARVIKSGMGLLGIEVPEQM